MVARSGYERPMNAKTNSKCHVSFSRLDGGDSLDYKGVNHFIFRIGPGVGVGVGVDQDPGVGAGVGVGTSPPRLRFPGRKSVWQIVKFTK